MLFEKGEKPRNNLNTIKHLGFRHAKRHQKSIANLSKIDADKRHAKSIADAERHRRTPWTLAIESKTIRGKKWADIGDTGEQKRRPKTCQNH